MSDAYSTLLVHGLLPLALSENGDVRFAVVGRDDPAACVSDPSMLPDCDISLRLFPNASSADGWIKAAKEFGGNAVWTIRPDVAHREVTPVLVVRSDRPRRAGTTLDDCIELVVLQGADLDASQKFLSRHRATVATGMADAAERAAWQKEWNQEIAQLSGSALVVGNKSRTSGADGSRPLCVEVPDGPVVGDAYDVTRVEGGLALRMPIGSMIPFHNSGVLSEDLIAERDAFLRGLGLERDGDDIVMEFASFSPETVARIKATKTDIKRRFVEIDELQQRMNRVAQVVSDTRTMDYLRHIHGGSLLVCKRMQDPGAWLSAAGEIRQVSASTREAMDKGMLSFAWTPVTDFDPEHPHAPTVLTLSSTAKAILEVDIPSACATILEDRAARGGRVRQKTDFATAMADALSHLHAGRLNELRELAGRSRTEASDDLRDFAPWAVQSILIGTDALLRTEVSGPRI